MPKVQCAHCGAAFTPDACRARYCDGACYHAAQRQKGAESLVTRFWAKVEKSDRCWLWTGGQIRGYGQFNLGRVNGQQRTVYAHRQSWAMTHGPIADNLQVCHVCDVPLCVNPAHMFLGTAQDNLDDARAKGRLVDGAHRIKLSGADMSEIQRCYAPGRGAALARRFNVSSATISRVVHGLQRKGRDEIAHAPIESQQPFQPVHAAQSAASLASTVRPIFGQ